MSLVTVLREPVTDARAWTAATVGPPDAWHFAVSDDCVSELRSYLTGLERDGRPLTEIQVDEALPVCRRAIQPLRAALVSGRGFVVVDGVPMAAGDRDVARTVYWLLGQLIGEPFEQDIEGTLLYDVRDTGESVTTGSRFSATNAESSFHTDNAFGPRLPDIVGLLCLQTAKSGGQSQLLSAHSVHNALLRYSPDVLETLYGPFLFDRRGQIADGESPVSEHPVFHWDGRELTQRYMHYYIEVGHHRLQRPLTREQTSALDALQSVLREPDLRVEFELQRGQMLFTNNRWILHNRTAFEDSEDVDQRRHYLRLWLSLD